jgi:hypothetical protein
MSTLRRPRLEPERALGLLPRQHLELVAEHDRVDAHRLVAPRDGQPRVVVGGQLAGLEHEVERGGEGEDRPPASRAPQRPPGPHLGQPGDRGHRLERRRVGVGAVEHEYRGTGVGEDAREPRPQAPAPLEVGSGARGVVGAQVLDQEPLLADNRRRGRQGQEQRLDAGREPPRDRHAAGQVPQPRPVTGHEEHPGRPGARRFIQFFS